MANSIFSVFDAYDFFGKSLPGMTLVIGVIPLLPINSIPVPSFFQNLLAFISVLISVLLLGTLLGEAVHTVAILFEKFVAWVAGRVKNTLSLLLEISGSDRELSDFLTPSQPSVSQLNDEGDSPQPSIRKRVLTGWRYNIQSWLVNRYKEFAYSLWSHRDIFENRISSRIEFPNPSTDFPDSDVPFTEEHLIEESVEEYDIHGKQDLSKVYSVVTSTLSSNGSQRAFKLQSRYAFCRSMWVVTFFLGIFYLLSRWAPKWIAPHALAYNPYIAALNHSQIGLISVSLIGISLIFAYESGAYKRDYLEYLISEFYVQVSD